MHIFIIKRIQVNHFLIAIISKFSFHIIYISNTSTHTCCKISSGITQNNHSSTRHVFTTMITHTFYNHIGA